MVTQTDLQNDYVVKIKGKKVDIVYMSSDEDLVRNFLVHVIKTSIFEDLRITIKGPKKIEYTCNVTFTTDTAITNSTGSVSPFTQWTDSSTGGAGGIVDI